MFPRFLAVCSFFCAVAASAQHLGEAQQEVVAREGPPIEENHAKGTAIYRNGPWKIDVTYANGIAKQVTVTKLDSLTEDEIQSILAKNADGATWRELQINGDTRIWQRSDLATARCARIKPRSVELRDSPLSRGAACRACSDDGRREPCGVRSVRRQVPAVSMPSSQAQRLVVAPLLPDNAPARPPLRRRSKTTS